MLSIVSLLGFILTIFPLIAALLALVWLFQIKKNSDAQVDQNKVIITLLREAKEEKI